MSIRGLLHVLLTWQIAGVFLALKVAPYVARWAKGRVMR